MSRGANKSKDHKIGLENLKLIYELQKAIIKLLNDYSSIVSGAKLKTIQGKGIPIVLVCMLGPKNASKITNSTCTSESR